MAKELGDHDIKRQDLVDNAIFDMLSHVSPESTRLEWDIEVIASIRERVEYWVVQQLGLCTDYDFYPYVES